MLYRGGCGVLPIEDDVGCEYNGGTEDYGEGGSMFGKVICNLIRYNFTHKLTKYLANTAHHLTPSTSLSTIVTY
jgi:hypothetical protein